MLKYLSKFVKNPMAAGQDGPPDLDELFKDLKNKVDTMFNVKTKNNSNGGGSNNKPTNISGAPLPVTPILIIILLLWLSTGFYIVDQGQRGVVLRFGENTEVTQPGPRWHIPFPIEIVEKVNLEQVRTIEVGYRSSSTSGTSTSELRESLMLTGDKNIIDLQFAVQYNLKSVQDFLFENRSAESAVRGAAETSIREVVGKNPMDFVLYEGREEIAIDTKALMQNILDEYKTGINITSVTMQNAQPPEQVQAAFDDAVKAQQDKERQKTEGLAYANDIIPKAKGSAKRLIEEANGYRESIEKEASGNASRFDQILTEFNRAPEVTRNRLFLEAQEGIMSSVSKIIIDQKESNSLMYLPLDKIIQQQSASGGSSDNGSNRGTNLRNNRSASDVINSIKEQSRGSFSGRDRGER
ncbi:MAG: FtsH protease activity modulator HflK [Methylophilaceae bacterium]